MSHQSIWVIGSVPSLKKLDLSPPVSILSVSLSETTCYFATSDGRLGHFPLDFPDLSESSVTYEPMPDVAQIACGCSYVACRKSTGELWVRGAPFPDTFTRVLLKHKDKPLPFVHSITGAPFIIFGILSHGRFCIVTAQSVLYQKRSQDHNWYISSAMFLGTALLLDNIGRAYTMTLNAESPEINEAIQIFSEDSYVFTTLFSCNESLFFLKNDDHIVSYGYNRYGCLGVGHENTVSNLLDYKPNMRNETIFPLDDDGISVNESTKAKQHPLPYLRGLSPWRTCFCLSSLDPFPKV
jgi:hypothetical protein